MYMLHKMSEVRGWSHNDMMDMSKTVFFRYYGYWYQERLAEEEMYKRDEAKRKMDQNKNDRPAMVMNQV